MSAFTKSRRAFFFVLFPIFFTAYSFGESTDEVLIVVHDREITKDEFLYHFKKTGQEINQPNITEYLDLFIDFQLKLAQAREEGVDHNIGFINELAEYRLLLAAPYLTDKEKEEELAMEASERLHYEVDASHILLRLNANASPEDTIMAYTKAIQIRNRIMDGESFKQLALFFSDDPNVSKNEGRLGYFTAFQTEYPFESAVYKMRPGEISMPVRSNSGYHIIQLTGRRKISGEVKTEQEIIDLIIGAKDERTQMIEDAFVEKLKKVWSFEENPDALETICGLADERVYKGNFIPPVNQSFDETLFFIDGKNVYQKNLIDFIESFETTDRYLSIREYIHSLYKKFVASRLIQYENYKLEEKYPEFRFQLQEYRDAMLLLGITRQKVWLKAESDSTGLEKFYRENKQKYIREESVHPSNQKPEYKTLDEVYAAVLSDYQNSLMKKWIEDLRNRYDVKIDEEVLSSIY
ncbi:peptidylprolyl isomerase [Bacteroidota bacterium]